MAPKKAVTVLAIVFAVLVLLALLYRGCSGPSEKRLFARLSPEKATRIEIVRLGEQKTFEKNEKWQVTSPIEYPANEEFIDQFLDKAMQIKLNNVISTNPAKHTYFQVDETSGSLVNIYLKGRKNPVSFITGKRSVFTPTSSYVRLKNKKEVYLTDGVPGYMFSRSIKEWRDKDVITLEKDAISEINLEYDNETVYLFKKGTLWLLDDPEAGDETDPEVIDKMLEKLKKLTASDIILPEDVEKHMDFSFDKPTFQLMVKLADGESHRLIIGGMQSKFNYYVKKDNHPTVFSVGQYLIEDLNKTRDQLKKKPETPQSPPRGE